MVPLWIFGQVLLLVFILLFTRPPKPARFDVLAVDLRWYGTLNMDQKVCLNMVKKDQLRAIALKKRN